MKNRRKLSRVLLGLMPERLRFALMRQNVSINPQWPSESLEIKIADCEEELASAYRLLHNSYVHSGFMNPDPTGMRVLPQHLLPQTTTIVAKWEGKVIGTLSLIRDNPFGLPLEKIFDISSRRFGARRLAEVSSLAVDPAYRGQINTALFPLFRYVYQYARDCFGIDEFVIAVNPSMVDLYLGFMCFEKLSASTRSYDFVKGAPAVGMYLDFDAAIEKWKKTFGHRPADKNFLKYWSEKPTDPRNRMPERQYHSASDPIVTPQLLVEFFLGKAQLAGRLSFKEVQSIMEAYPFPEFQKALQPLYSAMTRKSVRLETRMQAQFGQERIPSEVMNVSLEGLLLRTKTPTVVLGDELQVNVWLNETTSTELRVRVRWRPENNLFGLQIVTPSIAWLRMIETLESEYKKIGATPRTIVRSSEAG